MLDVILPGTGGTMPLKSRWLASAYLRYNGHCVLIDCGEGTQIALREAGCSLKPIDLLCLTHFHADHCSGLPGLLLSMGNDGRTEPLTILGPPGCGRVVQALRIIAPELPFPLEVLELSGNAMDHTLAELHIQAFGLRHGVTCYGYVFTLPRAGKFDPERARAAGIPLRLWSVLQKQASAELDGVRYTQDQVLGPARQGLKLCYTVDTRPTRRIVQMAEGSDLFICEGMFAETEKLDRAKKTGHMLFSEAADLAAQAGVKELWLTHFSPSLPDPAACLDPIRGIFEHVQCARDGMKTTLRFQD